MIFHIELNIIISYYKKIINISVNNGKYQLSLERIKN